MLQAHTIRAPFEGLAIRVPDPVVFAFHKLLVSRRRIIKEKAEKDLLTGRELLSFLIDRPVSPNTTMPCHGIVKRTL